MRFDVDKGDIVMNVYDFDGTIYNGDSSIDFFLFELKTHVMLGFMVPIIVCCLVLGRFRVLTKEKIKSYYFSFFRKIGNVEEDIKKFAELNGSKIADWYINIMQPDDVIITASPQPLVQAFLNNLMGQECIGTQIDLSSGKIIGKNCYGEEKVNRFRMQHGLDCIDEFYTDSQSDIYMARYAKNFHLIKKDLWGME